MCLNDYLEKCHHVCFIYFSRSHIRRLKRISIVTNDRFGKIKRRMKISVKMRKKSVLKCFLIDKFVLIVLVGIVIDYDCQTYIHEFCSLFVEQFFPVVFSAFRIPQLWH